jgi:hypothetical protein
MTCLVPEKEADGLVRLKGKDFTLRLKYDPKRTDLKIEEKHIEDARLNTYWGESVYRLVFIYKKEKLNDQVNFVLTH